MSTNNVVFESTGHGRGRLWINGTELHGIESVSIGVGVDERNRVTVTFFAATILNETATHTCEASDLEKVLSRFDQHDSKVDYVAKRVNELTKLVLLLVKQVKANTMSVNKIDAVIQTETADIAANTSAVQSAVQLINGFNQRLADAIAAAQSQGATDAQLQSFADLHAAQSTQTQALAEAVAANTPAAPGGTTSGTTSSAPAPTGGTTTAGA